jgi:curved DNA-binding protein
MEITLEEAYHGTTRIVRINNETLKVKVRPGTAHGQKLRIPGRGDRGLNGGEAGDLLIEVHIAPHPLYTRSGDDLIRTVEVPWLTMILGGRVAVKTLKGTVDLSVPPTSQNGARLKLNGLGMPGTNNAQQHGDLYVELQAVLPRTLSAHERNVLQQLRDNSTVSRAA